MKKIKLMAATMLLLITTICMVPTTNVSAISKQRKANRAYAKALKKNKIDKFTQYDLVDVTGNGVKELLIKNRKGKTEKARRTKVYHYKKGKVKKVLSISGSAITYNRKYKWIVKLNYFSDLGIKYTTYKYNGKKIVKKAIYKCEYITHRVDDEYGGYDEIDKRNYYKIQNGKTTAISEEAFNAATDYDDEVYPGITATKKQLIKKLSK